MKLLKNKLAVTIIVLSVSFLGLIVYTVKRDDKSLIESGAGAALNPIQGIFYKATDKVKETLDFFLNFSEVKEENKALIKKNEELEDKLLTYSDLKEEKLEDIQDSEDNYDDTDDDSDYDDDANEELKDLVVIDEDELELEQ